MISGETDLNVRSTKVFGSPQPLSNLVKGYRETFSHVEPCRDAGAPPPVGLLQGNVGVFTGRGSVFVTPLEKDGVSGIARSFSMRRRRVPMNMFRTCTFRVVSSQ